MSCAHDPSPHADRLAARVVEAVRVGVEHGPSVVVIHHVFRPDATMQIPEVGQQLPLHATALGKAMLAFMPDQMLDDLTSEALPKLTKHTHTAVVLRRELAAVRDQGVATERDEAVLGESSVAAPIFDSAGAIAGAIGVAGDTERIMPRGPAKGMTAAVIEAARGISRELGAPRWPHVA
jgi:DNA-binding IclR family transcriptional regulator